MALINYINRILHGQYLNARIVLTIDVILSAFASFLAIIMTGSLLPNVMPRSLILSYSLVSLPISALCFWLFKTHGSIIRHMMLRELSRFIGATVCKLIIILSIVFFNPHVSYLQTTMTGMLDFLLTLFILLTLRIMMQLIYEFILGRENTRESSKRVLVYGIDDKAASLVTRLKNSPHFRITGFITYSESNRKLSISDLPVTTFKDDNELERMLDKKPIDAILFAHRAEARSEENRLLKVCLQRNIKTLYAPSIDSMGNDKLQAVREINIEDLLDRPEIQLSMRDIVANFSGKVILVTGAAGSIGSELCRQLAKLGASKLIMFDSAETPMHNLRLEFEDCYPDLESIPIVGDVRNKKRIDYVMRTHHPQIVFHAAAYKHVPLMEENPCEAVHTNVIGSRNVADKCLEYDVDMMVMISTDKAVNPTNIMGCSKRLAEIYVQSLGLAVQQGELTGKTRFVTTRFGNVLGSNGSVIPRFAEQIAKGGPVTVTHPEINRFFMTIPEACKLVMEAATISIGNQIFVFDMGQSVKIAHLAERMIQLAGYKPNEEIKIEFTGLRPGEKLYEEVLSNEENTIPTGHNRIRIAKVRDYDYFEAKKDVEQLELLAKAVDIPSLVKLMKQIVPEFISKNSPFEQYDNQDKE